MLPGETPTELEKWFSIIISILAWPIGIVLAVLFYFKWPPGYRGLGRDCAFISIVMMTVIGLILFLGPPLENFLFP